SSKSVARFGSSLYARNFPAENNAGAARVLNVSSVTIPKWPFPPPRELQSKSGSSFESRIIHAPSTILTLRRWSQVKPHFLANIPYPPPSVRPARPTVLQDPAGRKTAFRQEELVHFLQSTTRACGQNASHRIKLHL